MSSDDDFDPIGNFMSGLGSVVEDPGAGGDLDLDAILDPERPPERPLGVPQVQAQAQPARQVAHLPAGAKSRRDEDIDEQAVVQRLQLVPDAARDDFRHLWPRAVAVMLTREARVVRELEDLLISVRAERAAITEAATTASRVGSLLAQALQAQAGGKDGLVEQVKLAGERVQLQLEQLPGAASEHVARAVEGQLEPIVAELRRAQDLVTVASASIAEIARREKELATRTQDLEQRSSWGLMRRIVFAFSGR